MKIELTKELIDELMNLPEQGMGYQLVDVILKNKIILKNRKVINSTYLLLLEDENDFDVSEIEDIKIN